MKAQITITGQIGGNFKLKSALSNYSSIEGASFNSFHLNYDTIGEAKQAMRAAWRSIKNQDDNTSWHDGLSKDLCTLSYNASIARLNKIQG